MAVKKSVPILLLVWIGLCGIFDCSMDDFKMLKAQKQSVKLKDNNMGRFSNASTLINNLLSNYDTRLRPNFGGDPLDVDMEVVVGSFDSISEVNMDFTVTIFLNQYWTDSRLEFGESSERMTLMSDFAEQIWVPDTFIANDKYAFLHDVTEKNKMIKLKGNGQIMYGMRFTTTLSCMMDLRHYPLDTQNCTIEIESYGYTNSEVNIRWIDSLNSVKGVENLELPQFKIAEYRTNTLIEREATGAYVRLSLSFLFRRYISYFLFQTYLPSILIVMLSWVSFWISHQAISARVALGITTVLTMTTISTGVRASLPRISYIKAIDIYLVTCFIFVFAALLECAAVNYFYWSFRTENNAKLIKDRSVEFEEPENAMIAVTDDPSRVSPLPTLTSLNKFNFQRKGKSRVSLDCEEEIAAGFLDKEDIVDEINKRKSLGRKQSRLRSLRPNFAENIRAKRENIRVALANNINIIDAYSRIVFPTLFIFFNATYWSFYIYHLID